MPTSKKRKKQPGPAPVRARGPQGPTHPHPSPAAKDFGGHPAAARASFVALAETEGHLFPAIKGYEPFGPPVECWTNAWAYAQATGLGYAEGVARMPDGWHAHAWCVTTDGAVIEPTLGYDRATEYRGWQLNIDGIAAVRALIDEAPRTSFLEAGLASGVADWEQIRDRFCSIPGTT